MTSIWTTIQTVSGLALSGFTCFHLTNVLTASLGRDIFDNVLLAVRELYQHPIVEAVGAGAIVAHVVSGIYRPKPKVEKSGLRWLHRMAGYAITGIIGFHVFQMRLRPLMDNLTVDYAFASHTINGLGDVGFIAYTVLLLCGLVHTVYGLARIFQRLRLPYASDPSDSPTVYALLVLLGTFGIMATLQLRKPAPLALSTFMNAGRGFAKNPPQMRSF